MSDREAMQAERDRLVQEMIEMQKQFIAQEREGGISPKEYFTATDGMLKDYRSSYMDKAMRVSEISRQLIADTKA